MRYKLSDLVKGYRENLINRDGFNIQMKLAQLKNENIDDLVKERDLYNKKVCVVDNLLKKNSELKAPIEKYIIPSEYLALKCFYIDNIKDRKLVANKLNTTKACINNRISTSMKKLKNIEINLD